MSKPSKPPSLLRRTLTFLLNQWLLIGIGIACVLAYFFPDVAAHGGIIRSQYSILYGAVALIFLISGLSISGKKLLIHAANWRLHLVVQGASFLLCPATMYALVRAVAAGDPGMKIDRVVLVGYILTACIPTTIASNVMMTRSAGGDEAAALVEVLIGNVFGPVVSPVWTVALIPKGAGFEQWEGVSSDLGPMYRSVFKLLGLSVYLPLAVGQLVRWKWTDRTAWAMQTFYLNKVGSLMLLLLIWTSFSSCFATSALRSLPAQTLIFTLLINPFLYLFWTALCFLLARLLPSSITNLTHRARTKPAKPTPTPPPATTPTHRRSLTERCTRRCGRSRSRSWRPTSSPPFPPFPPTATIAICFCGPAKTAALGIPLLYAMWGAFDAETKAKMSVPVILYTTEQIVCAHFLVRVFGAWVGRVEGRRRGGEGAVAVEVVGAGAGAGKEEGGAEVEVEVVGEGVRRDRGSVVGSEVEGEGDSIRRHEDVDVDVDVERQGVVYEEKKKG